MERNTVSGTTHKKISAGLLFGLIALALSLCLCIGGVFAWLAYNRDLSSDGMEMTAGASANLVIAPDATTIKAADYLDSASPFSVTFEAPAEVMYPCSHDLTGTSNKLLYYSIEPEQIDYATGLPITGDAMDTAGVETDAGNTYYRDYTVYVASHGAPLTGCTLYGYVEAAPGTTVTDTVSALSVDFWVNGTYKDTLNVAGKSFVNNGIVRNKVTLQSGIAIPQNTEDSIEILMRVYFDGNLKKDDTHTYITSKTLSTDDLKIVVRFEAV